MATKTLGELMDAVATRLATLSLTRAYNLSPGSVTLPSGGGAFVVTVPPVDSYRAAFARGTVAINNWPIYILTGAQMNELGQRQLSEYLSWTGSKSAVLALENEPTLGGVVSDLQVQSSRPLGIEEAGAVGYFGGLILLTVLLPGV